MARKIGAELVEALPIADRSAPAGKHGWETITITSYGNEMPAVITECGYLSSQKDVEIMKHPDFVSVQATAIARGILWWLGLEPTVKLVLSMTTEEVVGVSKFKDVPAGHWAESAVKKAADEGIISGFSDDTFRGDVGDRYQLAVIAGCEKGASKPCRTLSLAGTRSTRLPGRQHVSAVAYTKRLVDSSGPRCWHDVFAVL